MIKFARSLGFACASTSHAIQVSYNIRTTLIFFCMFGWYWSFSTYFKCVPFLCSPKSLIDPPLSLLSDPQQLTHQFGLGWKNQLHVAFLQHRQGSVRSGCSSQHEGQTLWADLSLTVHWAIGPSAPIYICGLLGVCPAAALLRQPDQELPLIQVLGLNTWSITAQTLV